MIIRTVVAAIVLAGVSQGEGETSRADSEPGRWPYLDPSRPVDERVADLISRMTLEEKVSQMMYNSEAIERLKVPAYNWWNECLHGVARSGRATVFPQAIGLAATFDEELIFRVASAIGDEARAIHHEAVRRGRRRQYGGLTFWTPNINIFRDPRWGRGQETYGEDPFLTGRLGTAFVRGLQGDHPVYLKAAACAKHFAVHSGPEADRHRFNASVSAKDLHETYLPAFKALVDAGVEGVMCAYNRINDEPCCGSTTLLRDILRDAWGFQGYVVTDCWALADLYKGHKVTASAVESAALGINSGVNLNCGDVFPSLVEAVRRGLVEEETIDRSLAVLLRTRFRLGLFDPPGLNPYAAIRPEVIDCAEHRALAREAAVKSVVLLKNRGRVLPLKKDLGYLCVVGPQAASVGVLLGNYHGLGSDMVTVLEGIVGKLAPGSFVQYKQGCLLERDDVDPGERAIEAAKEADAVIAVMGLSGLLEGEEGELTASKHGGDRLEIGLPANQVKFLKRLRAGNDKPIILVLTGGGPMAIPEVHELADAILYVWYPGEEGGNGVADVLFGDACPSGRLPVTFPKSLEQLPPYEDYGMAGRTYRYMTEEPLYPFGFGLSYTEFAYSGLTLAPSAVRKGEAVEVVVTVENVGRVAGEEVVQFYLRDVRASVETPIHALKGFCRVALKPRESKTVRFRITPELMCLIGNDGRAVVEPGEFVVTVGGVSPGSRGGALGSAKLVEGTFVVGE